MVEGHTCVLLNTCEESRQTKRIAWASMRGQLDKLLRAAQEVPENYEDLISQPGPPPPVEVPTEPRREPEQLSHDDLEIGMDAVEQMPPLEGAAETASSTEIGGQSSSWRGTWSESWTAGSVRNPLHEKRLEVLSSKRGSSGGPLEDEHERNWRGRNRTDRSREHTH